MLTLKRAGKCFEYTQAAFGLLLGFAQTLIENILEYIMFLTNHSYNVL